MTHDVAVLSHAGHVRPHNEDDSLELAQEGVYVVADGMGGHALGEVASRLSVEAVAELYRDAARTRRLREKYRHLRRVGRTDGARSFQEYRLRCALEYGNERILERATEDRRAGDMGTTIVGMAVVGRRAYLAHVGDSRAYRFRGGRLQQLTEDHSLANEYMRTHGLRPEDLANFPYHNVVMRALGMRAEVDVETGWRSCLPGDRFLLCTDGLTDLVPDGRIREVLEDGADATTTVRALVDEALSRGGTDNVTALVLDLRE